MKRTLSPHSQPTLSLFASLRYILPNAVCHPAMLSPKYKHELRKHNLATGLCLHLSDCHNLHTSSSKCIPCAHLITKRWKLLITLFPRIYNEQRWLPRKWFWCHREKKKIIANESGCVSISHKIDELHDVIAGNSRIPFIYSWTRDGKKEEHAQEHTHSRWKHIKWWVDACKFVQKMWKS